MASTAEQQRRLPLLTSSRAKDFRACQRLHFFRYLAGYRPAVESEALRFGTLIHLGLEAWWRAPDAERLDAALAAIFPAYDRDPFEHARAEAMMLGYHARWIEEPMTVLAVEIEFTAPLVNPMTGAESRTWQRGGKLDAVAHMPERGGLVFVEHKSAANDIGAGSDYWKRLRIDGQVSTYFAGAKALGFDVVGCVYDVLGKPAQRPLSATPETERKYTKPTKAEPTPRLYANQRDRDESTEEYAARIQAAIGEDPDRYYQRGQVVRLENELAEADFDDWQTARAMREAELAGRFPRNPDACLRYGSTCAFFDCCTGVASVDDPTRFRRTDPNNPNEELSSVA